MRGLSAGDPGESARAIMAQCSWATWVPPWRRSEWRRELGLGALFLAAMWLDALLWVFVLLGLEEVHIPLNVGEGCTT